MTRRTRSAAAWAAGAFVLALGAARRYRRLEITTLPELFERHYSTTARVLGVIGQLVIQIVIKIVAIMLPLMILVEWGNPLPPGQERAWAAALTLILIVMLLNLGARLISRFPQPGQKVDSR